MARKTSEIKAHAKYSASGSERWVSCPGSIKLSEKAPPQRESKYAKEGTEAHACLEFMLRLYITGLSTSESVHQTAKTKKWDSEMMQHACKALLWIEANYPLARKNKQLLAEQRVDASPFTCEGQFGTLDCAIVDEFGTLTVIDYKYGAGVAVEPKENMQLIYYALGLAYKFDLNFSDVELVIIQPRAYRDDGQTIRTWKCSMDELLSYVVLFKVGVDNCESPNAPLNSGDWCRWCPAATICPEIKNKAFKSAQIAFADDTGIESIPEPHSIQIENLGTILDACERLEVWMGKVREHAVHVLERGERVSGFKLVAKRSVRKWVNADSVRLEAKKRFGTSAFEEPKLLTPAQLEKRLGREKVKAFINRQSTSISTGVTLAREDDKRPAVQGTSLMFGEQLGGKEDFKYELKYRGSLVSGKNQKLLGD